MKLSDYNKYVILLTLIFINPNNGEPAITPTEITADYNKYNVVDGQYLQVSASTPLSENVIFFLKPDSSLEECDCLETEKCNEYSGKCECLKYHEREHISGTCIECPREGESCFQNCCRSDSLTCWKNECKRCQIQGNDCISQEALIFVTASQVALVTALVMAITALIALLYRTCIKSRLLRRSQTNPANVSNLRIPAEPRVSLTSLQQRVVTRLRDRPPVYETRRNYDYQRDTSQIESSPQTPANNSAAPIQSDLPRTRTILPGEPPPCYDNNGETSPQLVRGELPPPYTVSIVSTNDDENGITNTNFVTSDDKVDKENIDNVDKVIHI